MSLLSSEVKAIKQKYFLESARIKKGRGRINELVEEMARIIKEEAMKDFTEEELEILGKFPKAWIEKPLFPGERFYRSYGADRVYLMDDINDYLRPRFIKLPTCFLIKQGNGLGRTFPVEIMERVKPLNNEILKILEEQNQMERRWDRLFNIRTSKRWIKQNFPEIYENL